MRYQVQGCPILKDGQVYPEGSLIAYADGESTAGVERFLVPLSGEDLGIVSKGEAADVKLPRGDGKTGKKR